MYNLKNLVNYTLVQPFSFRTFSSLCRLSKPILSPSLLNFTILVGFCGYTTFCLSIEHC